MKNTVYELKQLHFYWSFDFGRSAKLGRSEQDHLFCTMRPMALDKLKVLKQKEQERLSIHDPRELIGNIWEDFTVRIGKIGGKGHPVKKDDFLDGSMCHSI
jgi:hypothetical protein